MTDSDEAGAARRRLVAEDVRLTRLHGGNMLRIFWSVERLLRGPAEDLAIALNTMATPDLRNPSVYMEDLADRIAALDRCDVVLDQLLAAVSGDRSGPIELDFTQLDLALGGIEDANAESDDQVGLLLALVTIPPRWIVEAPSDATLAAHGRSYTFRSLWDRFVKFHELLNRALVVRYAVERPRIGLHAIEPGNEPDYVWTPIEVKIEGATTPREYPLSKYVTELQLAQIPESQQSTAPYERTPWGFQAQDGPWTARQAPVPVLDYDWGPKFDWYVRCFAELHAEMARGIKEEAARHGVEVATVSASVTHNNIDYLIRMHRALPGAFAHIDKIGIHPYHWFRNDVWDTGFVRDEPIRGWPAADPRRFAGEYYKRFDFLEAFRGRSGDRRMDREIKAAFGGRKLWVTEFGIGSKVPGAFNAPIAPYTQFIRPRSVFCGADGYREVVWEDLWSEFLDQVDAQWLRERDVECFLVYGLRELGVGGFDLDDDDRSNLALLSRDGSPRLQGSATERIRGLMRSVVAPSTQSQPVTADGAGAELQRRPWRRLAMSASVSEVQTMLSLEERQLLYWLTAHYRAGAGGIVDGGCFVGGSTVALAEGLRAAGGDGVVDVYDMFEVEGYMAELYFGEDGLRAGESFRPVFDRNTAHVEDLLRVHEGDVTQIGWSGDPIEVLFVDLSKSWSLNDYIVEEMFSCLIPGRSVVVQQDYVFPGCPWVILTMEHFRDYFEPVAFAEYSSMVYVCREQVPRGLPRVSELSHDEMLALMDQAASRFLGYPRDVVECAKATLLFMHGDHEQAHVILDRVKTEGTDHHATRVALQYMTTLV